MSAKRNKNNENGENANNTKVLKVINRDGDSVVDGSVLNPRDDEIHIYLQQLLSVLKKGDLSKLSIVLTSAVDSTKTFSVPREAISVQKRKVGKKLGKYLVVSLFNLTTPSGVIVSPSALPTDKYRLRIVNKKNEIATDSFHYRTPVLLVGKVKDSDGKGLVSVEDLEGDLLSDKTVAVNPNGTFITEVKAGKILEAKARLKPRKHLKTLKAQEVIEEESVTGENDLSSSSEENITNNNDDSYIGVIHAVTDTDLFAIAPLENNTEFNTSVASRPIEVSEASTLATTLAKEGAKEGFGDLAGDVADQKLKDLQNGEDTEPEDIGCDIEQFASLCSEGDFNTVGSEFRNFVGSANCNFSEFNSIKEYILQAPKDADNFIGRGYCSHVGGEVNQNKPCEVYSGILAEHKSGKIKQLPCPPSFCKEFSSIKPPACVEYVGDFCERPNANSSLSSQVCRGSKCVNNSIPACVHKPVKDLYCAEIGKDIAKEECKDEGFEFEFVGFNPGWIVVKNSQGNEFCVPSNLPPNTPKIVNVGGSTVEITPEVIAEECEVNRCHNDCAQKFGFTSPIDPRSIKPGSDIAKASLELHNCHFACDAEAGRVVDCGNSKSKYFSNKCCVSDYIGPVLYTKADLLAQTGKENFDLSDYSNSGFEDDNFDSYGTAEDFGGYKPTSTAYYGDPSANYGYGSGFSGSNASGYGGFSSNYNGPSRGPIFNDIRGCLCEDFDNFDDKGFIEEGAAEFCNDSCPLDYEKDPNSEYCLPICQANEVRDPKGFCRKKCSPGFIEDAVGNCNCPEGKVVGRSGKCEDPPACPDYCRSYPLYRELLASHDLGSLGTTITSTSTSFSPLPTTGSTQPLTSATATSAAGSGNTSYPGSTPGYIPGGNPSGFLPPECQKCLLGSNNVCPPGQRYDSFSNQCVSNVRCGPDQYSGPDGVCRCNYDNSVATSLGPEGCKKQNYCTGNMYPNPSANQPNQPLCICPSGLSYWDNNQGYCVAQCPVGTKPNNSGSYFSNAPIPCEKIQTECPTTTPIKCSDGRCAVTQLECGTQCPSSYVVNPSGNPPCKCPTSTPVTYNGTCVATCPAGLTADYPYVYPSTSGTAPYASPLSCLCPNKTYPNGNGTCNRTCTPGEVSSSTNSCTCAGGGYFGSGNTCQCSSGQTYTTTGCTNTSNYCVAGTGPTTNPSNPCSCASPGYVGTNGICQCSTGQTYTATGCTTTSNYCSPGIAIGTNGCTCNPSGGSYFSSSNTCTCPSGSGSGQTYTAATGCSNTSSTNYCSPGITIGTNGCTCNPSGGAYNLNGYCTCSSSSSTAYTAATGCHSTSTHICAPGEVLTSSNSCYCANGGYFNSQNVCTCTSSGAYTAAGCSTTTCPSSTPILCSNGTCAVTAASCPSRTCGRYEISSTYNPCTCAPGSTLNSGGSCQCPAGQVYKDTGCIIPTVTFSDAALVSDNLRVNLNVTGTEGTGTCYYLYKGASTSSIYSICSTGTSDIPLSTLANNNNSVLVGDSLKFCLSIDSAICSAPLSARDGCTNGKVFNSSNGQCVSPTITLSSVTISGGNVTISFSVDPYTCLLVKDASNNTLKSANLCGVGSFSSVFPTSDFTPLLVSGTQVKLCNQNDLNNCSGLVAVP